MEAGHPELIEILDALEVVIHRNLARQAEQFAVAQSAAFRELKYAAHGLDYATIHGRFLTFVAQRHYATARTKTTVAIFGTVKYSSSGWARAQQPDGTPAFQGRGCS